MDALKTTDRSWYGSLPRAHVVAFTSGKGGVGKTCITANVGVALARKGYRVCIFDADTGLANINILLDLRPAYTLEHVLKGEKTIREVLIRTSEGLAIVPGASGIADCANLSAVQAQGFIDSLRGLEADFDYCLIDTGAGISESVLQFVLSAQDSFIVVTPDPTSLTDAFSLLKLLKAKNHRGRLRILVNMADDYPNGLSVYRRFSGAVEKYLGLRVEYGGFVAKDDLVAKSIRLQMPFVTLADNAPASRCLRALSENIIRHIGAEEVDAGFADYWEHVVEESEPLEAAAAPMDELPVEQQVAEESSVWEQAERFLALWKESGTARDQSDAFIVQLLSAYVERFGGFPTGFPQLVHRWLESEGHSASRLVEMVSTLQALYALRHRQPMFSLEDGAARLVAQAQGSESALRDLVDRFRSAYRQAFHGDVFDARGELLEAIKSGGFTEHQFEELQSALREAFEVGFCRPYKSKSEALLEFATEALSAMASEEAVLRDGLDALAHRSRGLVAHREALLASLGRASTNAAPLMSAESRMVGDIPATDDLCEQVANHGTSDQVRLAARVFDATDQGIIITDAERRVVSVNQAFTDITGYRVDEVCGWSIDQFRFGQGSEARDPALWQSVLIHGRWQGDVSGQRKDGSAYPAWLSLTVFKDETGKVLNYIAVFADISDFMTARRQIDYLAHFDPLTNLPNRALLQDRASTMLIAAERGQKPGAVLFVDLDRFKSINDTHGHHVGDRLLQQVARRIESALRQGDTLSRSGGDEFILLLPETDSDGATHVCEKVMAAVSGGYEIDGVKLAITPSIGISIYPHNGEDFSSLCKCADAAMYRAKRDGRNCYRFFTNEMQARAARRQELENDLRHAIEHGDLYLHYQPLHDIRSGKVIGAEALVRWQHPTIGPVPPAELIAIAEESGLILPLGEWVLDSALAQARDWGVNDMENFALAVNISAKQLDHPNFVASVCRALEQSGVKSGRLELELTESIAMGKGDALLDTTRKLHEMGVGLSIDDFGTAHSCLSYLKRFQVHKLKIDRAFVSEMAGHAENAAIVDTIINMAKCLKLRTIAEGVETEHQLAYLRAQGCDEFQGYYVNPPVPAAQFARLLQAERLSVR